MASRNASRFVSIAGIAVTAFVLILLLIAFYFLTVRRTYVLQAADMPAEPMQAEKDAPQTPVRVFLRYIALGTLMFGVMMGET